MSNGKNGRKKNTLRVFVILLLLVVAIGYEMVTKEPFPDLISPSGNLQTSIPQEVVPTFAPRVQVTPKPSQEVSIDGELMLTMIDCGQADSFLFEQNGMVALVDCGTRFTGKDVVEYLKEKGITRIDYVFCTHPHDDHQGGLQQIITNFEIGKIIMPEIEPGKVTANWYMSVMQEIQNGKYLVEAPIVGNTYPLGDAIITILGPITKQSNNLNNYSIVMMVSFGEMDVLMTGDAETEVEKELLEAGAQLDAEILKLGHHGSDTSTSDEFLEAVSPEHVLISCKLGNKHEHPIESTMKKLENRKIKVYRTDESGTVVVRISADDVIFDTEPDDYLSGVELEKRVVQ